MDRQGEAVNEIERQRSAWQLIGATFTLYRRYPWLFMALAGAVIVPYELIVLLATGVSALDRGGLGFGVSTLITLTGLALVLPLISALHVHAVQDVRDGKRPETRAVARRSVRVLPVVSAAVVMSFLGATFGLVALIVPGVLLYLRWSVAAPAAALEDGGWTDALRRSAGLTKGNYWHVFGLLVLVIIISAVPGFALAEIFGRDHTTVPSFLADTAVNVVLASFTALATALLYYDLKARFAVRVAAVQPKPTPGPSDDSVAPTGHRQDPASYSDEDRPPGWYVNPDKPWRMRYWAADGKPGWSKRTAKTPKQTLAEWKDLRWVRERR
ncbi:MAG TPA: hypothetical protein VHZ54_18860 [Solirubrobacterales bacterium]|nr:hypothetical protein [Solirubrobacterales bacterium]